MTAAELEALIASIDAQIAVAITVSAASYSIDGQSVSSSEGSANSLLALRKYYQDLLNGLDGAWEVETRMIV